MFPLIIQQTAKENVRGNTASESIVATEVSFDHQPRVLSSRPSGPQWQSVPFSSIVFVVCSQLAMEFFTLEKVSQLADLLMCYYRYYY